MGKTYKDNDKWRKFRKQKGGKPTRNTFGDKPEDYNHTPTHVPDYDDFERRSGLGQ